MPKKGPKDSIIITHGGKKIKFDKRQVLMLKYHDKIKDGVPREFTDMLRETMMWLLHKKYGKRGYTVEFGGSYRRGGSSSGDVDILVKSSRFSLKDLVELLYNWGIIFETLTFGRNDFKGLGRCPGDKNFVFRIDILFTQPDEWIAALIHFTGDTTLNTILRQKAKDLRTDDIPHGAKLSQKGLFKLSQNGKPGKRVVPGGLKSERQLFKIVGHPYLIPTQRNL